MSTLPNSTTTARRQPRVRRNARASTTSHTPRRERLTLDEGVKMFDLGVEIGQMRAGASPQEDYTRGYREGFDAGRESEPANPLADAVEDWLTDPTSIDEDPADGPGLSVRCVISEVLALVGRDGAELSEAARGAATLAAAVLLDALGVVPTDLC